MENADRTSRSGDSRAADEGKNTRDAFEDIDFNPANLNTKDIPPREGYVQRWVRTSIGNESDQSNVYRNSNMGWKPRPADSVKKGALAPTIEFNGDNVIGLHDTILMERPEVIDKKHKEYERQQAAGQMQSVENDMLKVHDSSSGMGRPTSQNRSSVSTGRVAPVTPD